MTEAADQLTVLDDVELDDLSDAEVRAILDDLEARAIIERDGEGGYATTELGRALIAHDDLLHEKGHLDG